MPCSVKKTQHTFIDKRNYILDHVRPSYDGLDSFINYCGRGERN